jgi:hypothetical protein
MIEYPGRYLRTSSPPVSLATEDVVRCFIDDRLIRKVQPDCVRTVHEWNVFNPFGLALSEKQIPRFVGNVSN